MEMGWGKRAEKRAVTAANQRISLHVGEGPLPVGPHSPVRGSCAHLRPGGARVPLGLRRHKATQMPRVFSHRGEAALTQVTFRPSGKSEAERS